ncbi:nuclease and tudor domain-containing protein [Besnoitia besnoiti]|uniref:Nuclease and tudor domain-containing protein n=1 Tax=Besnoitia besnoiti TaxID=94643 RepID=A0A2A9M4P4_BESBE|nr:nuclease and tudor domain-containing protein [Besnoitia besnoiti]PFH32935.1 nuclease and tudor domain-containing protein [Besnoitia besnoiti]
MASGVTTVKEVISGDTFVLMGAPRGGPPPEKRLSLSSVQAPRVAMKSLSHEVQDEPYGWTAREFMRNRLVGQQVEFKVDYGMNNREYGTIVFNGENVSHSLLRQGFAKLKPNRNPPCAPDIEELQQCQDYAEQRQLGVWAADPAAGTSTIREMTWAVNDSAFVKGFVAENKGKKLPGIVEYVRDGGCMRVAFLLPQKAGEPLRMVYVPVLLSGLQVDGFKREQQEGTTEFRMVAEPYAAEARFFVEVRLLNRDVEVRIEGCDEYGNVHGTVYHPKGNISVLLLQSGLAKIQNGTVSRTECATQLRQAQQEAQQKQLRKWKGWSSSTADVTSKNYMAQVAEVLSGDSIILRLPDGSERRVYLASIRCPRAAGANRTASKEEESIAFETKEFVRRKLIGKNVKVTVEYLREPLPSASGAMLPPASDEQGRMHFVSLWIPNSPKDTNAVETKNCQNIAELLLQAGLARTIPHRADDERAAEFDKYMELEQTAIQQKKGMHAPQQQWKIHRVIDLLGPANAPRANSYLQQLERIPRLDGVVEHVFAAGRFKIRIPSQNIAIAFVLGGIRCPQTAPRPGSFAATQPRTGPGGKTREAEPFGEEALAFTRSRVLQRDVHIKVDSVDKAGNFIGTLWYAQTKQNLAADLLDLGYAHTVDFSLARCPFKEILTAAEERAKAARLNIWSLPGALEAEENVAKEVDVDETLPEVSVSHVEGVDCFYIQDPTSAQMHNILSTLSEYGANGASHGVDDTYTPGGLPRKGEIVIGKYTADNMWYRARVDARDSSGKEPHLALTYIDFGNRETLPLHAVRRCPDSISTAKYPPQAKLCCLSGLLPPPEMEFEAAAYLDDLTQDLVFQCKIEKIDMQKKRHCVLTPQEDVGTGKTGNTVNEKMLRNGLARLDKKSKTKYFHRFQVEEEAARKAHVNVWRYGDCGDDDNEDFPSLNTRG